jgi:hypothetical protein
VDAFVYVFRSYHALPEMHAPDGMPVHAAYGFASTLVRMLAQWQPTHFACCFDAAMTSFRNALEPGYKLGRTEAPADLEPQFEICEEIARALGLPASRFDSGIELGEKELEIAPSGAVDAGRHRFMELQLILFAVIEQRLQLAIGIHRELHRMAKARRRRIGAIAGEIHHRLQRERRGHGSIHRDAQTFANSALSLARLAV